MSTPDPGLDLHEWETEWEALQDDLRTDPAQTLSELDNLVERMLVGRGFAIDDPVASEGIDRDVVADFLAAREITELVDRDEAVDPGDIAAAIRNYREVYEYLIADRASP
jgi:hypothetical protein